VHGVYEGHLVLCIYQLTSALANDGLFVIDLLSQSFVVLDNTTSPGHRQSVSSLTYLHVGPHLETSILKSAHQLRLFWSGTALHCIRESGLGFHGWLQ